jgi:phospholipid transport system substrate-binding protein
MRSSEKSNRLKSLTIFLSVCLALSIALGPGLPFRAEAGDPRDQIKQTTDKVVAIFTDPSLKGPDKTAERRKLIRNAADERFDWEEMAKRSLARFWPQRTSAEKKEFVLLFRELLGSAYLGKLEHYSREKIAYEGETIDGDYATTRVRVVTTKNQEILIEYRMLKKGDNWVVYDVSIEGVSLVNNYRTQFNSVLVKSPYSVLVEKLRAKVGEN